MSRLLAFGTPILLTLVSGVSRQAEGQPLFEESDVFVGGQDDINTYRIPSLICTKKGTVLAFCEGRRNNNVDGSPTHLVLKRSLGNTTPWKPRPGRGRVDSGRSRQHNLTWQPLQIVLRCRGTEAYMNSVPIIDQSDGTIHVLVNYYDRYGDRENEGKGDTHTWRLQSVDDGATWSQPVDITASVGRIALGPGIGIQMRNGRLVAPTYQGVIFSDDHGTTWKAGGMTTGPVSETQLVERVDGSLMLNARGSPHRTVCISKDGGENWGAPWRDPVLTDSELWGGCQASLLRYTRCDDGHNKNRLLFANPADPKHRFNLTVRLSYDEGNTWPVAKLIKKGTGAYSSMTVFPDGNIGIIYETGNSYDRAVEYYAKLAFARFNLEWLTAGKDRLETNFHSKEIHIGPIR